MTKTIPRQQVVDALNEAFQVEEFLKNHYRLYSENDRSDADLLHICEKSMGKKIKVFEHKMPWGGGPILSFMLEFDDRFEICLLSGLNHCHAKFALCKELFHVIIASPEFRSIDFDDTVAKCVTGGSLTGSASIEFVAEIAAMEYLFPYRKRQSLVTSGNIDVETVAQSYRLPRILVEQYLTSARMDTLHTCYKESSFSSQIQ